MHSSKPADAQVRRQLAKLELSNAAVWEKEERRIAQPEWGANTAPWPIRAAYIALCVVLDRIYDKRPIQRFWFLEVGLPSVALACAPSGIACVLGC